MMPKTFLNGHFNPRPPRGGRHSLYRPVKSVAVFQSTPPARGATTATSGRTKTSRFQSTPPARGATNSRLSLIFFVIDFNPRPREGGDAGRSVAIIRYNQFQSTPPRGGRRRGLLEKRVSVDFNPRPREGGDYNSSCKAGAQAPNISIHAPARGATMQRTFPPLTTTHFNPRPPARGATSTTTTSPARILFQSTPPREGGDICQAAICQIVLISIHAPPARGATGDVLPELTAELAISIHAPPARGATTQACDTRNTVQFQSTPPPRGGRRPRWSCRSSAQRISIHAPPARGATAKMHSFTCGSLTNK